jgi:hypothetical protein
MFPVPSDLEDKVQTGNGKVETYNGNCYITYYLV